MWSEIRGRKSNFFERFPKKFKSALHLSDDVTHSRVLKIPPYTPIKKSEGEEQKQQEIKTIIFQKLWKDLKKKKVWTKSFKKFTQYKVFPEELAKFMPLKVQSIKLIKTGFYWSWTACKMFSCTSVWEWNASCLWQNVFLLLNNQPIRKWQTMWLLNTPD